MARPKSKIKTICSTCCFGYWNGLGFALIMVMTIALAHWQGRISPVFDVSRQLLLVTRDDQETDQRREVALMHEEARARAREVAELGVHVLLCGAVSRTLETALVNGGVRVVGFLCGEVEDVLDAFWNARLHQNRYRMPGFPGKKLRKDNRP